MAALVAILTFAAALPAQQPQRPQALPPNDQNTQLFRGLLHFHQVQPESVDAIRGKYDYSNLIVVVMGDPKSQRVVDICRAALANGGAVLIAADTDMKLSGYFPRGADVSVTGHKVFHSELDKLDGKNASRPIATPTATEGRSPFSGLERVATNQPSFLLSARFPADVPLQWVAALPPRANVLVNGFNQPALGALPLPFACASTDDRLPMRCMIVADPDVFSNRMIYTSGREENPTDNLKLANQTVQWLKGSGRTRCLFIENGEPVYKFDDFEFASVPVGPPIPPLPTPSPESVWEKLTNPEVQKGIADAGNSALDELERNNAMNRGIHGNDPGRKAIAITVLAGIVLTILYLIIRWRAITGFVRKVFRPIPRDPAMLGPDVPVGSLGHRRLELLRSADYGPVVRQVVLQVFQDRGLSGEYTSDKLPPVDIAVARPEFLREALRSLWAVVHSTTPVGYGRWKQLEPLLAAVRAAAADDRWRFVATTPRDAAP